VPGAEDAWFLQQASEAGLLRRGLLGLGGRSLGRGLRGLSGRCLRCRLLSRGLLGLGGGRLRLRLRGYGGRRLRRCLLRAKRSGCQGQRANGKSADEPPQRRVPVFGRVPKGSCCHNVPDAHSQYEGNRFKPLKPVQ
jgi:hypothetical protein